MFTYRLLYARRYSQTRKSFLAVIFILSFVFSFLVAGINLFVTAHSHAVKESAEAQWGNYEYQFMGDGKEIQSFIEKNLPTGKVVGVSYSSGNVIASQKGEKSEIITTTGPMDQGKLVMGRYPQSNNEATISKALASYLEISLGDFVDIAQENQNGSQKLVSVVIEGITEDPADIKDKVIHYIETDADKYSNISKWVTDTYPENANIEFGTTYGRIADHEFGIRHAIYADKDNTLSFLPYLYSCMAIIYVFLVFLLLLSSKDEFKREIKTLSLLSLKKKSSRRLLLLPYFLYAFIGLLLGVLLAVICATILYSHIGILFNERWNDLGFGQLIFVIPSLCLLLFFTYLLALSVFRERKEKRSTYQTRFSSIGFFLSILGLLLAIPTLAMRQYGILPLGHFISIALLAICLPYFIYTISCISFGRTVLRKVSSRNHAWYFASSSLLIIFAFACSFQSSMVLNYLNWDRQQILDTQSYFSAQDVPNSVIESLEKSQPEVMKKAYVFYDTYEPIYQYWIIANGEEKCFQDGIYFKDGCSPSFKTNVAFAKPGNAAYSLINHAGPPALNEKGEGKILAQTGYPAFILKGFISVDNLQADPLLNNNIMPGLVLPYDEAVFEKYGIKASDNTDLVITNFDRLTDEQKSDVRSTIISQAPFSFYIESNSAENRQLYAINALVSACIGGLAGVLTIFFSLVMLSEQKEARKMIEVLGGGKKQKIMLMLPFLLTSSLSIIIATIWGRLAAMDHIPFLTPGLVEHHYGLLWLMPLIGLLSVPLCVYFALKKVITRD